MKPSEVKESEFTLSKVDLSVRGLKCNYAVESEEGAVSYYTEECPFLPHEDVRTTQKALRVYLAKILGYTEVIKNPNSADSKKLLDCITVTKVHIKGDFDNQSVILSGVFTSGKKKKFAMNSPLVQLKQDIYGFEGEITTLVDTLCEQVYDYLFEAKYSKEDDLFSNTHVGEDGGIESGDKKQEAEKQVA